MGQYEQAYKRAFYNAVKSENPDWEIGKPFNSNILNKVSRKDIEDSLVKVQGEYGTNLVSEGIDIKL